MGRDPVHQPRVLQALSNLANAGEDPTTSAVGTMTGTTGVFTPQPAVIQGGTKTQR